MEASVRMPSVQSTVRGAVAAVQSVSSTGMLVCVWFSEFVFDDVGAVEAGGGGSQSLD